MAYGRVSSNVHRRHYQSWDEYGRETKRLMTLLEIPHESSSFADLRRIYDWCRPSVSHPTVELRVFDPKLSTVEDELAVYFVYGIVKRITAAIADGSQSSFPLLDADVREAALNGAARFDLSVAQSTVHPLTGRMVAPLVAIEEMIRFVEPVLREEEVWDRFDELMRARLANGTGSQRLRAAFEKVHDEFRAVRVPGSDYDSARVADNSRPMSDSEARALTAWVIAHSMNDDLTPEGKALADMRDRELREQFLGGDFAADPREMVDLRDEALDTV
jgi:hypothetical protein